VPGVNVSIHQSANKPIPQLILDLDEEHLGFTAYDAANALLDGDPAIAIGQSRAEFGTLNLIPQSLADDEIEIVGARLRQVLTASLKRN
jgi:hypothetical protein